MALLLLTAVTLVLSCVPAHAQSTRSGVDRLRITAERDQLSLEYGAVVTATGTIGRVPTSPSFPSTRTSDESS